MDIKILVAAHKKYWMPDDDVYMSLQVGAEGKESLGKKALILISISICLLATMKRCSARMTRRALYLRRSISKTTVSRRTVFSMKAGMWKLSDIMEMNVP